MNFQCFFRRHEDPIHFPLLSELYKHTHKIPPICYVALNYTYQLEINKYTCEQQLNVPTGYSKHPTIQSHCKKEPTFDQSVLVCWGRTSQYAQFRPNFVQTLLFHLEM